jgi:hypothetical protein
MAKEIATPRAYALAEMTNSNELLIQNNMREMVDKAIESGLYLIELKQELPHGQFMSFCEEYVRVKKSQRENYMIAASADPQAVIEYKSSDESSGGLQGLIDKVRDRKPRAKSENKIPVTGNLEDEPAHEEVEKWDQEELNEELKRNPIRSVVYGLKDLEKLTANVLHGGIVLGSIIEHVDITPEQFAHALSREVTHDGDRPRSAVTVAEFTDRLNMYMDLIVQTKGLLDTKPKLKVV